MQSMWRPAEEVAAGRELIAEVEQVGQSGPEQEWELPSALPAEMGSGPVISMVDS